MKTKDYEAMKYEIKAELHEKLIEKQKELIEVLQFWFDTDDLADADKGQVKRLESELSTITQQLEEKEPEIKFTPASILTWIQDGHAVPPNNQKDLLNYMIEFVNHFTILNQEVKENNCRLSILIDPEKEYLISYWIDEKGNKHHEPKLIK